MVPSWASSSLGGRGLAQYSTCHTGDTDRLLCPTKPCHVIPYNAIPYHAMPCHDIPYHTMPYHTMPYHTIPLFLLSCLTLTSSSLLSNFTGSCFSSRRPTLDPTLDSWDQEEEAQSDLLLVTMSPTATRRYSHSAVGGHLGGH